MAKVRQGRLNGLYGMYPYTASELHAWADKLEKQIQDPKNQDDPRWLRRWAQDIRRLAEQKERSRNHKKRQQASPPKKT